MVDWIVPGGVLAPVAAVGIAARAAGRVDDAALMARVVELVESAVLVGVVGPDAAQGPAAPGVVPLADDDALVRWVRDLGPRTGIGPGLVAVMVDGDAPAGLRQVPRLRLVRCAPPGEPDDLLDRLRRLVEQGGGFADGDRDPTWVVPLAHRGGVLTRVDESLGVVADGAVGTRGSLEEDGADADELVLVAGAWAAGEVPTGLPGPLWTRVDMDPMPAGRSWFDCRTGVLLRHVGGDPDWSSMRFACLARPGTAVMRVVGPVHAQRPDWLRPPTEADVEVVRGTGADGDWCVTRSDDATVAAVGVQRQAAGVGQVPTLERIVVLRHDRDPGRALASARGALDPARAAGVDRLLAEQRAAWAEVWRDADLRVLGDDALTLGARFAVHHLVASAAEEGEAPVGARGLTGRAYAGHVFWDADVFVLPALAAIRPARARAMLAYRQARLPAARAAATAAGLRGAWFPWESAASGRDVTPATVRDVNGDEVPVLTGAHAIHISADVAWAAVRYATWTGDTGWLAGPGRPLVVEPARFFASRVELDAAGAAHLRGVMGPDEYHGPVDDDVHTNVMARWTLRTAAALVAPDADPDLVDERERWLDVADRLVVRYDPERGVHEQFDGFAALEPLVISTLTEPPVAADVLLGRDRVASSQVVKQPDVLMAHHLVPDEMVAGSLPRDLDHEGPRLAHGSSLSPAIVAGLLARAGRPDDGVPLLRLAARLDLDEHNGTTAGGLHLAAMGSVWQALVGGFAGVEPTPDALRVDPRLPSAWDGLDVTVRFHGARVRVAVRRDGVTVRSTRPVPVRVCGGRVTIVRGALHVPLTTTPDQELVP